MSIVFLAEAGRIDPMGLLCGHLFWKRSLWLLDFYKIMAYLGSTA